MKMQILNTLIGLINCLDKSKFIKISKKKQSLMPTNTNDAGYWEQGYNSNALNNKPLIGTTSDVCGFIQWVNNQPAVSAEIRTIYNNLIESQPQRVAACNNTNQNRVKFIIDDTGGMLGKNESNVKAPMPINNVTTSASCTHNPFLSMRIDSTFNKYLGNSNSNCVPDLKKAINKIPATEMLNNTDNVVFDCDAKGCSPMQPLNSSIPVDLPLAAPVNSTVTINKVVTERPQIKTVVITTPTTISQTVTITTTALPMNSYEKVPIKMPVVISDSVPSFKNKRRQFKKKKWTEQSEEDIKSIQKELLEILKVLVTQQDESKNLKTVIASQRNLENESDPTTVTITKSKSTSTQTVTITSPRANISVSSSPSQLAPTSGTTSYVLASLSTNIGTRILDPLHKVVDDNLTAPPFLTIAQPVKTVTITRSIERTVSLESNSTKQARAASTVPLEKQSILSLLKSLNDIVSSDKAKGTETAAPTQPKLNSSSTKSTIKNKPPYKKNDVSDKKRINGNEIGVNNNGTIDDLLNDISKYSAETQGNKSEDTSYKSIKEGSISKKSNNILAELTEKKNDNDGSSIPNKQFLLGSTFDFLRNKKNSKSNRNDGDNVQGLSGKPKNKTGSGSDQESIKNLIDQITSFINKDAKTQQDIINVLQAVHVAKKNLGGPSQLEIKDNSKSDKAMTLNTEPVASTTNKSSKSTEPERTVTVVLGNNSIIDGYKQLIIEKDMELQRLNNERQNISNIQNSIIFTSEKSKIDPERTKQRNASTTTSYKIVYKQPLSALSIDDIHSSSSYIPAKSTVIVTLTQTITQSKLENKTLSKAVAHVSTSTSKRASLSSSMTNKSLESVSAFNITIIGNRTISESGTPTFYKAKTQSTVDKTAKNTNVSSKSNETITTTTNEVVSSVAAPVVESSLDPHKRLQSAQLKLQDTRFGEPKMIEVNLPIGEIERAINLEKT